MQDLWQDFFTNCLRNYTSKVSKLKQNTNKTFTPFKQYFLNKVTQTRESQPYISP